ncbi:MAG: hemolysin III family protein [Flavobacteriaceae bacterium]|nr:hemolysin III family protein [Flavobacteriaceae bacterium]
MQVISLKDYKNEELWNVITHFLGVIMSIIGIPFLFYFDTNITFLSTLSIILFSFGLLLVYSSSSIYHFVISPDLKKRFQVLDHISIYYLILGSYAPVCLITLYDYSGISIFVVVLTLSILGTLKKLFFTGKYEFISLLLYLAMGWLIIFDINSLFNLIDFNAKLLLILGGVSYTFGIIFYALDKIKYFHSIWHIFVLTGSVLHYFTVLLYII